MRALTFGVRGVESVTRLVCHPWFMATTTIPTADLIAGVLSAELGELITKAKEKSLVDLSRARTFHFEVTPDWEESAAAMATAIKEDLRGMIVFLPLQGVDVGFGVTAEQGHYGDCFTRIIRAYDYLDNRSVARCEVMVVSALDIFQDAAAL